MHSRAGLIVQVNNILHGFTGVARLAGEVGMLWVLFVVDYYMFVRGNSAVSIYMECLDLKRNKLRTPEM
ncbi:MAG: hypothetical protein NWE88_12675 [Candidatus Bathyarchaeota archaeon]|nr:hypothetical protein [Candidatus Bathyarchaeota archaeon]